MNDLVKAEDAIKDEPTLYEGGLGRSNSLMGNMRDPRGKSFRGEFHTIIDERNRPELPDWVRVIHVRDQREHIIVKPWNVNSPQTKTLYDDIQNIL